MITIQEITEIVCKVTQTPMDLIISPSRKTELVSARFIIMKIALAHKHTLSSVGKFLCNRDHTTVINGIRALDIAINSENNLMNINIKHRVKFKRMISDWNKCKYLMPKSIKLTPHSVPTC